jgi:cell division protein FtsQ
MPLITILIPTYNRPKRIEELLSSFINYRQEWLSETWEILISENPLNSQRFRNSIEVLMALPEELLDEVEFIEARSKDDVQMSLRSSRNQRIIWGDSSDSALKSKVLQALMLNHRKTQSVTFDVSSPNAPVVRFDNF